MMSIPEGSGSPHTVFTLPEGTDDIDGASVSATGRSLFSRAAESKSDVWIVDNFDPAYRK